MHSIIHALASNKLQPWFIRYIYIYIYIYIYSYIATVQQLITIIISTKEICSGLLNNSLIEQLANQILRSRSRLLKRRHNQIRHHCLCACYSWNMYTHNVQLKLKYTIMHMKHANTGGLVATLFKLKIFWLIKSTPYTDIPVGMHVDAMHWRSLCTCVYWHIKR